MQRKACFFCIFLYECTGHFVHYYIHVYEGFKNESNA